MVRFRVEQGFKKTCGSHRAIEMVLLYVGNVGLQLDLHARVSESSNDQ